VHKPAPGHAGDCAVPDRGAWRPRLLLPVLSVHPLQLPLLPQPPLPDLSAGRHPGLASRAARPTAAGSLLPGHVHVALRATCYRSTAAGDNLLPAVSYLRRGFAATGRRSALPGWPDWHARHLTDLDARPALPSPRPLSGASACPDTRWRAL